MLFLICKNLVSCTVNPFKELKFLVLLQVATNHNYDNFLLWTFYLNEQISRNLDGCFKYTVDSSAPFFLIPCLLGAGKNQTPDYRNNSISLLLHVQHHIIGAEVKFCVVKGKQQQVLHLHRDNSKCVKMETYKQR